MNQAIKAAFPVTIPVLLGYLSIGIAFGLLFETQDTLYMGIFTSLIVYAGAMQLMP